MGAVRVELERGRAGEALAIAKEILTLRLDVAFAPGQPIRFKAALEERIAELEGRTVGSKKQADGRYEVRVRLVVLRREDRLALEKSLGDATLEGSGR